jgi:drug/metabolite transporter (DMT)-like permease
MMRGPAIVRLDAPSPPFDAKIMSTLASPLRRALTRNESILLVVFCTFIGAAAQILFKLAANQLKSVDNTVILARPWIVVLNVALIGGLALYGLFTLLFIFALRDGELSVIYPVITLNYVWVMLLSAVLFHEALTPFKLCGVAAIMLGVIIVGKGGKQ